MSDLGNKKIIAENILYYMNLHNKTRREVCDALGFKYPTFSDWVTGKKYPRIDKIEMMAKYSGISKADLVEKHSTQPADDAPQGYYHDPETARIAEEMRTDPQIRAMADATRGMTPEQMKEIMEYIRFQKAKERGDYDF